MALKLYAYVRGIVLITTVFIAFLTGCTKKSLPEAMVDVSWKFSEGSSGFVAQPNKWLVSINVNNEDSRVWTVVPDMIAGESLSNEALAKGICLKDLQKQWNTTLPVTINTSPSDKMGKYEEYTYSPADEDGQVTVQWGDSDAVFKKNGKESLWAATNMTKGDSLEYEWECRNFVTFKTNLKGTDQHYLFHLGPFLYDASSPSTPAYLLVAEAGAKDKSGDLWHAESYKFFPLTAEEIKRQVEDTNRSDVWRSHFLILFWSQPRPIADAGRYVLEAFNNSFYPVVLRKTAARSLLELHYNSARDALINTACDLKADFSLRITIISRLDIIVKPEECSILSGIAGNSSNPVEVRTASLECLNRMGEQGKKAVQQFVQDKDLKETAEKILNEKDQSK